MKFLSLLLGLVIFVAVLYQSVFTPTLNTQSKKQGPERTAATLETLQHAKDLEQELKRKLKNGSNEMNYENRIKNQ